MSSVVLGDGVRVAVDRQPEDAVGEDAAVAQATSSAPYHASIPNLWSGDARWVQGPACPIPM